MSGPGTTGNGPQSQTPEGIALHETSRNDNRRRPSNLKTVSGHGEPVSPSLPLSPGLGADRNVWGIRRGQLRDYTTINLDDYERKYPPDPYCKELDADARVWRVYLDEAGPFNQVMIENFRDNIDLLLVFAGLFSAVVASTAQQSSQALQPNYSQITANLVQELINITRASAQGQSTANVHPSTINLSSPFPISAVDQWVNRFWFTSLSFSLAAALAAALAKQWLLSYVTFVSGTPRDRVRMLQFRQVNFERWGVPVIIGLLPALIHISLIIYFIGLVLFLSEMDWPSAVVTMIIASVATLFYLITNILPVVFPNCPYKTPISMYVYSGFTFLSKFFPSRAEILRRFRRTHHIPTSHSPKAERLQDAELELVVKQREGLDIKAVAWLLRISTNPSVTSIVYQAFSGLPLEVTLPPVPIQILDNLYSALRTRISQLVTQRASKSASCSGDGESLEELDGELERLSRSMVRLYPEKIPDFSSSTLYLQLPPRLQAMMLTGSSLARSRIPHFLAEHYFALRLSPVMWMHILAQAASWMSLPHADLSLADVQATSWSMAKGFLESIIASPILTRTSSPEPSTLLSSGHYAINDLMWQYVHHLYCPSRRSCKYAGFSHEHGVRRSHLITCLWLHGEGKSYTSPSDSVCFIGHLESIVNTWQQEGHIRRILARQPNEDAVFTSVFDISGTLRSLVSSGAFLDREWLQPTAPILLRVFRTVVGHGWKNRYFKFDHDTMRSLLRGYAVAVENGAGIAESVNDSLSSDRTILYIIGDAFSRKSPSALAYFRAQDGINLVQGILRLDGKLLTADIDPDRIKHRLIPISDMLHSYVAGLLSLSRLSSTTPKLGLENTDPDTDEESDPLSYIYQASNLRFYVHLTFRRVLHTPRYLPSWDAIDTVFELARLRPSLLQWDDIVQELVTEKSTMIEMMSGGRHWPSSGGPSLSYSIKKLKSITSAMEHRMLNEDG